MGKMCYQTRRQQRRVDGKWAQRCSLTSSGPGALSPPWGPTHFSEGLQLRHAGSGRPFQSLLVGMQSLWGECGRLSQAYPHPIPSNLMPTQSPKKNRYAHPDTCAQRLTEALSVSNKTREPCKCPSLGEWWPMTEMPRHGFWYKQPVVGPRSRDARWTDPEANIRVCVMDALFMT